MHRPWSCVHLFGLVNLIYSYLIYDCYHLATRVYSKTKQKSSSNIENFGNVSIWLWFGMHAIEKATFFCPQ